MSRSTGAVSSSFFRCGNRQYSTRFSSFEKYGSIISMNHNREKNESVEDYTKKCINEVKQQIKSPNDMYTFLVVPTFFLTGNKKRNMQIAECLIKGKDLSSKDIGCISPGHIAVYTAIDEFISHRPVAFLSQNEALEYDIKKAVTDNNQLSYLVQLSLNLFYPLQPDSFESIRLQLKNDGYDLFARNDKHNCATAIGQYFGEFQEEKYIIPRNIINPQDMMREILLRICKGLDSKNAAKIRDAIFDSELSRNLFEVSETEFNARQIPIQFNKTQTPPKLSGLRL